MADLRTSDALDFLRSLDDHSVDTIMTDPAYESLERHRKVGTKTRLKKEWFPVVKDEYYAPMCVEFRRVLAKHGSLILFGDDITQTHVAGPALRAAGFPVIGSGSRTFQREIIWDKVAMGMGYGARRSHERIIVQQWGRPWKWRDNPDYSGSYSSIQRYNRVRGGYPTEKPVELLRGLLRQFSRPGDLAIDPFLGSGSSAIAAQLENRRFIGCDIKESAVVAAREKLLNLEPRQGDLWAAS